MLEIKDLYWAVGFLEGEGSFYYNPKSYSFQIQAAQVQKEPLERLQRLFGGSFCYRKRTNPKHNNCWYWYASGARARGIMMTIFSLMSPRRKEQIKTILANRWGTRVKISSEIRAIKHREACLRWYYSKGRALRKAQNARSE